MFHMSYAMFDLEIIPNSSFEDTWTVAQSRPLSVLICQLGWMAYGDLMELKTPVILVRIKLGLMF